MNLDEKILYDLKQAEEGLAQVDSPVIALRTSLTLVKKAISAVKRSMPFSVDAVEEPLGNPKDLTQSAASEDIEEDNEVE